LADGDIERLHDFLTITTAQLAASCLKPLQTKNFQCGLVATLHMTPVCRQVCAMSQMPKSPEDQRAAESRRILASVNDEMQVSGLGNSLANRVGNHFAAREADQADKVEVFGRRIGRFLSLALCVWLIVWLAFFIARNAG
jgi:hypothetical protein